jgi:hypothetical protein
MNLPSLERYLKSFGKQVVKQAQGNLSKAGKKGALSNSIDFFVIRKGGTLTVRFKMAAYGVFVDKGVSGTKVKRSYLDRDGKTKSSPFKYTNKQPPSRIIDKWIVRKGIAPRDEKGRFMPRKSISFLIARSIKSKGIQGISFFQKPMMLGMKTFSKKFGKAIAEDIINNIK